MTTPAGRAPAHAATERLRQGPVLPTLLRLATPNVLAMFMAVLVGVAETYYVGRLGTAPLAAMALVFPFGMLTGMLSAGAMGGGVSSAVSRALGAGEPQRAQNLALHALAIGAAAGLVYTALMLLFGPAMYQLLGGRAEVLAEAVRYACVLFSGALMVWLFNTLASVLRGTGNMRVPSLAIMVTSLVQVALGGALGLGAGPVPRLGMVGVAAGHIVATTGGVIFLWWFLASGRARLQMRTPWLLAFKLNGQGDAPRWRFEWALGHDILRVGALACVSPLQSVLAVLICTALVAHLGVAPLAGYAIGQRLEFMLIPIAFGIGVASVPMVGMAIGAGDVARARRVAWTAGAVSAFNLSLVGLVVALWPDVWAGIFTSDPAVLEHARAYLRRVGPVFGLFGLGLTLYFASQGAGKVLGPVLAGTLRLVLVAGVGVWLAASGAGSVAMFWLVAAGMAAYGIASVAAMAWTAWGTDAALKRH